jgi:hypothetical protein
MASVLGMRWDCELEPMLVDLAAPPRETTLDTEPGLRERIANTSDAEINRLIDRIMRREGSREIVRKCLRGSTDVEIGKRIDEIEEQVDPSIRADAASWREQVGHGLRQDYRDKISYAREWVWESVCFSFPCLPWHAPPRLHHLVWARFADMISEVVAEEGLLLDRAA